MKKLKYVLMLAIIGMLSIGIGFGCTTKTPPTPPAPEVTVEGFTVKPSITVDFALGENSALVYTYDFIDEITVITDSLGNEYDVEDLTIKVLDSENEEVELNGYFFTATDVNGYKVSFTLTTLDGSVFSKVSDVLVRTESETFVNGIRSDTSLDLNDENIEEVKIYQYVLKDNGSDLTLKDATGTDFTIKAVCEDVTEQYASAINKASGVVDTTVFDGIYQIYTVSALSKKHVYFEQKQADTFVWNNLAKSSSVGLAGFWADGAIREHGTVAVVDSLNPIVEGRDGVYFSYTSTFEKADPSNGYGFNLKLYPVHTKGYYESFGDAKVIMDFYYTFNETTNDIGAKTFRTGEGFRSPKGLYTSDCPNRWSSGTALNREDTHSFVLSELLAKWDNVLRSDSYGGGFIGYNGGPDNVSTYNGEFTAYFGNLHIIGDKTYRVEHYFENETTGEYNLISYENITADENITAQYAQLADTIGYEFYSEHADSILSGCNDGNLVLKGYYRISGTSYENKGVIYDDKLNFNGLAYTSYTLTQYVIRADGDFDLGNGVKGLAVDVTSAYADIVDFNEGVVDLSKLDGVFALTVSNGSRDYTIAFERIIKGAITWNNVANVAGAGVSGLYENTAYNGNGTLSVADVSSLNNNHKYYDENTNYFVFSSNFAGEKTSVSGQNGFNLKLYPVHTKSYYESILATTDVTFLMRYYIALNDAGAPSSDQFSFYANMGYNDLNQVTYDDINCWGNDVSDADITSRFRTGTITLSQLLENWDNVISGDMGGGFLGYSELDTNSTYDGTFSVYFGNLMTISNTQYKIERYYEYPDGIGFYYLNETSTTYAYAPYGEFVEFVPENIAERKFADDHPNNVLSGFNDGSLVIKVYYKYFLDNAKYTVNVYLEDESGNFVRDAGYSHTAQGPFMETVTYSPINIPGYIFDANHSGAINSGLNRYQLVLNVYYARDNEWTLTKQTLAGVQTADTLQLSATNIEEITITQYLFHDAGSPLTLKDANGNDFVVKAFAYDVTDTYKGLVNMQTGLVDTSKLSGVFTFTVIGNKVRQELTFEQGQLDEFVWNNLDVPNAYKITDKYGYVYNGTGTFGAADENDPVIAGREGNYYVFKGDRTEDKSWGLKVYPVHSVEYYKALVAHNAGYEIAFDFYYQAGSYEYENSNFSNFHSYAFMSLADATLSNRPKETWNASASISVESLVNNWKFATANSDGLGYFLGMTYMSVFGEYQVYFGNFHFTKANYKVEYYLDGELDDSISTYIKDDIGASISLSSIPYLQGYEHDAQNVNNVLSGVNNGALTLKLYYYSVNESVTRVNGLNTTSTLDLGITDFDTLTITQYVVRDDGEALVLKDKNGEDFTINAVGIDVTETYKNAVNVETGIIDMTALDGIFCIKAIDGNNRSTIYVEQATIGTFVWNNIKETGEDFVTAEYIGLWGNTPYTGDGVLSYADSTTDAVLEGKTGLYWKSVSTKHLSNQPGNAPGVRIFPAHTFDYYQEYWYNAQVDVNYMYIGDETAGNENIWMRAGLYMDEANVMLVDNAVNWKDRQDNQWLTGSFIIDAIAYARAITHTGDYLGRIIQVGKNTDSLLSDTITIYFGGITSAESKSQYKVEINVKQEDGSFLVDEELSYYVVDTYGKQVSVVPSEIDGYIYLPAHENEVLTGINGNELTLKIFYERDKFTRTSAVINGLRSDATMQLPFGDVEEFKVTQYIIREDGEELVWGNAYGVEQTIHVKAVDVSASYQDAINKETGLIDTTKFDGLFNVRAISGFNIHDVMFEQYVAGQFTWNNITEEIAVEESTAFVGRYGNTPYTGDAVASIVTSDNDELLDGVDGVYWKSVASKPTTSDNGKAMGVRVFPVHTFDYYNKLWHDATVSINYMYIGDNVAANEGIYIHGGVYLDVESEVVAISGSYKWKKDNSWLNSTFVLNSTAYYRAIATTGPTLGRLVCTHNNFGDIKGDTVTIYVGGLTAVANETYAQLTGKKVSILGDSVSCYNGYSNNAEVFNSTIGNNITGYGMDGYGGDLASVYDTWWMQTINNLGMDLCVANSSGSSRVMLDRKDIAYGPAAYRDIRCLNLHDDTNPLDPTDTNYVVDPDIIMIYMGLNDLNSDRKTLPVGTFEAINFDTLIVDNGDGTFTYATPTNFAEAYAIMLHKISNRYAADVFVCTLPAGAFNVENDPVDFNDVITKLASKFGATVIDFYATEMSGIKYSEYTFDRIHPKATGMKVMADKVTETLLAKYSSQE